MLSIGDCKPCYKLCKLYTFFLRFPNMEREQNNGIPCTNKDTQKLHVAIG